MRVRVIRVLINNLARKLRAAPTVTQVSKRLLFAYSALRLLPCSFLYNAPILDQFLSDQIISFSSLLFLFGAFQLLPFETLQGLTLDFFLCLKRID